MKVKVIGSGSMWTAYNSASFLVDEDILVDMPNGMCKYLFRQNINPMNINHVLITHFHGDHYFDMPFYLLMKTRALKRDVSISCYKKGRKKIERITKLAFPNSFDNIQKSIRFNYNHEDLFVVNNYQVERIEVDHGKLKPSYGYIFNYGDIKVGFTGDSSLCRNVEYMASICSYLFCDCMFLEGTNKHMGIDNLEYLISKYPNCKFIPVHMEDITRLELKKMKLKSVIVSNDGDIIEIK